MKGRFHLVATTLIALATSGALAQPPMPPRDSHPPFGPPPPALEMALDSLDLSADQQAHIEPLLRSRHDAADAARPQMEAAHHDLAAQVASPSFDEPAIRAKAAALAVLDANRLVADAALLQEVRRLLTDDQSRALDRYFSRMHP